MKISNIEGSPKEIKDFCARFNLDIKDLIEKPKKEVNKVWIIIPSVVFLIFSLLILLYPCNNVLLKIASIVIGILCGGCATCVVQIKYNNVIATVIFVLVCFFILGICSRFIPLEETFQKINAITLDKYKEMAPSQKKP
ncbi:MAG: hypothetical protein AB1847_09425 [bacterium]